MVCRYARRGILGLLSGRKHVSQYEASPCRALLEESWKKACYGDAKQVSLLGSGSQVLP